jgi:hypothetical protein
MSPGASSVRPRILSPTERASEVLFGLIMVLSFTGALSVADAGRDDVRAMLIGAVGCNLAWAIIDAAFYLLGCITEHGRNRVLLREIKGASAPEASARLIADALPDRVAEALAQEDFARIAAHLRTIEPERKRPSLTRDDWRGAVGVFLLVFLSTFPVVLPFVFFQQLHPAMRFSNGIAMAMLFGCGFMLARYAGMRPVRTGLAMVLVGSVLVALTIALGG